MDKPIELKLITKNTVTLSVLLLKALEVVDTEALYPVVPISFSDGIAIPYYMNVDK